MTFRTTFATPVLLAAIVVLVALIGAFTTPQVNYTAVNALVMVVTVIGIYVFVGNSGIFSFGHVGLMAVGGYAAAVLSLPGPKKELILPDAPAFIHSITLQPEVAILVGGLVTAVVALLFAIPLGRLSGMTAALGTLSLLFIVYSVASNWSQLTNGGAGLGGIPFATDRVTAALFAIGAIALAWIYQRSPWGLRLRASREDETAARASGVHVGLERAIAFVISGFVVGVGGGLLAHQLGTITPDSFYLALTFLTLAMLVVGGITTLSGAVIGTVVIATVSELLTEVESAFTAPGLREVGIALIMLGVLLLRPRGITGGREIGERLLRRRTAAIARSEPSSESPETNQRED